MFVILHVHGVWLGESEILKEAGRKNRLKLSAWTETAVHRWDFSGNPQSCFFGTFPEINQIHPDYIDNFPYLKPIAVDFNHSHKRLTAITKLVFDWISGTAWT